MSWVKRIDILLAGKNRMLMTKKTLSDAQALMRKGELEDLNVGERHFLWKHLFEYYNGCQSLAMGRRDGTVKATLGIDIKPASNPKDFNPLITHLLQYETEFTFQVK